MFASNYLRGKSMPEMIVNHYDGKPFYLDNNTTRPDKTDGGIEKRKVTTIHVFS
jgi:hypothetical protein